MSQLVRTPWIQQQVEVVQAIRETFTEEIASFYNIFSPISYLKRWFRTETSRGDGEVADLLLENPEQFRAILDVIAGRYCYPNSENHPARWS